MSDRTGLPPSVNDELSDDSESEEEDEADEDSNGVCCHLDRDGVLMFPCTPSQPKSITRMTILMRKIPIPMTVVYTVSIACQHR